MQKHFDALSLQHKCYKIEILKKGKKINLKLSDLLHLDINSIHNNKGKKIPHTE